VATIAPPVSTARRNTASLDRPRQLRRGSPRLRRLFTEIMLFAMGVLAYFGVRGLTETDVDAARQHAAALVAIERDLGIFVEPTAQHAIVGHHQLVTIANWIYIWGHWPVIISAALWLAIRRPEAYRLLRNAMLLSGLIGIVIFVSYPVAPPRLADVGLLDTITLHSDSYRVLQPPAFVNQYAALPSLHVGWDLLIGLAIASNARRVVVQCLGALLPVAMVFAVVLTANHYLLDVVVGIALVLVSRLVAIRLLPSRRTPSRRTPSRDIAHVPSARRRPKPLERQP
jgi:hypothetical protein